MTVELDMNHSIGDINKLFRKKKIVLMIPYKIIVAESHQILLQDSSYAFFQKCFY